MFQIDPFSRTPIYEQIIEQTERFILSDILRPSDQLPSVRALSVQHSVNPRTILKAYQDLDARGIIQPVPGKGYYVCPDAKSLLCSDSRELLDEFAALAQRLAEAGVTRAEIEARIDSIYNKED